VILKGTFTAMITPFHKNHLEEKGLIRNIQRQVQAKVDGILLLGTTGEAATLSEEEQKKVIEIGVREAKGKTLILVGTGSNCTKTAIEKTKRAKELGADIALVVAPYYSKPTQEGIYRHFQAIASTVDIPLLIYNIQGRTGVNIENETLLKIAKLSQVIGVKESSGQFSQAQDVLEQIKHLSTPFSLLSGEDAWTLPLMAIGASGVISVLSNLVPEKVVELVQSALNSDFPRAQKIYQELYPLFKLCFVEVNPIPIKQAMQFCGLSSGPCRLPLSPMQSKNKNKLKQLLSEMQLLWSQEIPT